MMGISRIRAGLFMLLAVLAVGAAPAQAQLVDTPQNLLKAWTDAYATRTGEPMTRVYAADAQFWGSQAKEPVLGIDAIKQFFDRTGQNVAERSATITRMQVTPRKRLTFVAGTMEIKTKLKDGTARTSQRRFTMSLVREARRQWSIASHHASLPPE